MDWYYSATHNFLYFSNIVLLFSKNSNEKVRHLEKCSNMFIRQSKYSFFSDILNKFIKISEIIVVK